MISDKDVRDAVGISPENHFLFPNSGIYQIFRFNFFSSADDSGGKLILYRVFRLRPSTGFVAMLKNLKVLKLGKVSLRASKNA